MYVFLAKKTGEKNGNKSVQELFTKMRGRQAQLHTSHLHSSNSLYVNKVPLDVLLFSEPLHPTPFRFPPRVLCRLRAERHTRTHTRHAHAPCLYMSGIKHGKSLSQSEHARACAHAWECPFHVFAKASRERALFAQRDEILDTTVQISTRRVVGLLLKKFLKGKRSLPTTRTDTHTLSEVHHMGHIIRASTIGFVNSLSFPGGRPMGFSPLAVQLAVLL